MLAVTLRGLVAHKLRLALTAVAIVLGVSFVAATLLITDTINGVFGNIFADADKNISVVVRGATVPGASGDIGGSERLPIPAALLSRVRSVSGVAGADGVLFRTGPILLDRNGKPEGTNGAPTFGTNWVDSPASPYHLRSGTSPRAADQVVVDAATAARYGLAAGQPLDLVFSGGTRERFTISGITGYGRADNIAGATIVLFTLPTADRVLDARGMVDQIEAVAASGVSDTTLRDRIAATLPRGVEAATGTQNVQEVTASTQQVINSFIGTPLMVFAVISLFVGSFLIVNTFTILVAQRAREIGLLRALGATRRQVMASVLGEALATGVVSSGLGAGVGILLAGGLRRLLGAVGFTLPASDLVIAPRTFVVAISLGVIVTLVAATLPARRATRVAPVAALRDALPDARPLRVRRIVLGGCVTAAGVALLGAGLFGSSSQTLTLLGSGALVLFVGIAMLSPLVVRPLATILGTPLARVRGVPGRLARENAARSPRRTASTSAAIMIGVALMAAISVMASSFKASSAAAIDGSVRSAFLVYDQTQGQFTTAAADTLRHDRRFADVSEVRTGGVVVEGSSDHALAIDPASLGKTIDLDVVSGDAASLAKPSTVLVDDSSATAHGWAVGRVLSLQFPHAAAPVTRRIGAIYRSDALVSGYIVSLASYIPEEPTQRDSAILVNPAPAIDTSTAESSLKAALHDYPTLTAQTRDEFVKQNGQQLDQLAGLLYVLLALSVGIAFLGVVNTLALSMVERTRELGLLRALGMTRAQMRAMVRWESVIISLLGALLGLAVGVGLGAAVVHALASHGLDHLEIPAALLVLFAGIAAVLGVLAGVLPALRASRLNVLAAIATE